MKKSIAKFCALTLCLVLLFTLTCFVCVPMQAWATDATLTIKKEITLMPGVPGDPNFPPAVDPDLRYHFEVSLNNQTGASPPVSTDEIERLKSLFGDFTADSSVGDPHATFTFSLKAGEEITINLVNTLGDSGYSIGETGATRPDGTDAPIHSRDSLVYVDGNWIDTYPLAFDTVEDGNLNPAVTYSYDIRGQIPVFVYHYEYREDGQYDPADALHAERFFVEPYGEYTVNGRTDIEQYACKNPAPQTETNILEPVTFIFYYEKVPTTTIRGTIQWEDSGNSAKQRPDAVTIELLQDGKAAEKKTVSVSSGNRPIPRLPIMRKRSIAEKLMCSQLPTGSNPPLPPPPPSSDPESSSPPPSSNGSSSITFPKTGGGQYLDDGAGSTWSLANLILCVLNLGISLMLLFAFLRTKYSAGGRVQPATVWWEFWLLSALTGVLSCLIFLFTGNLSGVMVLIDSVTFFIMTTTAAQIAFFVVGWRQQRASADHTVDNTTD